MILVDSSAWIEFLRDTGSPVCSRVERLLHADDIATCHPIRMEVLAGARGEQHLSQLRGLLARASIVPTEPAGYEAAAALPGQLPRRPEAHIYPRLGIYHVDGPRRFGLKISPTLRKLRSLPLWGAVRSEPG